MKVYIVIKECNLYSKGCTIQDVFTLKELAIKKVEEIIEKDRGSYRWRKSRIDNVDVWETEQQSYSMEIVERELK